MKKHGQPPSSSLLTSKQRYDAKRQQAQPWRSLYNTSQWKKIRAEVLKAQPVCRICRRAKADTVDHVQRHGGDPAKFLKGPFQALCKHCHDTHKQSWEKGNAKPIGLDGWPLS